MLRPAKSVVLDGSQKPLLTVVIHTEHEFDWAAAFDREATSADHIAHLHLAQNLFEEFGICPTYVVDYPIATHRHASQVLSSFVDSGRALIGAHLHPWVSPPHDERVDAFHSYPGNLPKDLERRKLERLTDAIADNFSLRPTTYLAGRYGFGPHTASTLINLGYNIDLSPMPAFNFSEDGGPDWSRLDCSPAWWDDTRDLLCLPATSAFVGPLSAAGINLHNVVNRPFCQSLRIPGVLSRLRLFERLRLSPEGYTLAELRRLTVALQRGGQRHFSLSFHSPSLQPGCTQYVNSISERDELLNKCRGYFEFFLGSFGGEAAVPNDIYDLAKRMTLPS